MSVSVLELYRAKLSELLDSVHRRNNSYTYLVVDKYTQALIQNVMSTMDVLKHYISAVELITDKRQTRASFEAIYIVTPQQYVVDCIKADFGRSPPRYGGVYLFFVPLVDDNITQQLQASAVSPYIRICQSLLLDFRPVEAQVVSLDNEAALVKYYNRSCFDLVNLEVMRAARKLVSVCAAYGEYPLVRFHSPAVRTHDACTLPYMLASIFQQELDNYARANRNFPSVEGNRPQSVLIVLDRSIDLREPFLHEFSYEALVHDLLGVGGDNVYTYQVAAADGKEDMKGVLAETDGVWTSLRHRYIADAMDSVHERIMKFTDANAQFANIDKASTSQLRDVIAGMSGFSKEKDQLSMHFSMTEAISGIFNGTRLAEIAQVEQSCATGLNDEGKPPREVLSLLVPLLDDPQVSPQERVRLIALYVIYRNGLIEADFVKLCQHAKVSRADMQALRNLDVLGFQTHKQTIHEKRPAAARRGRGSAGRDGDDAVQLTELTRYVPVLREVLEGQARGTLDADTFPYTKDQPAELALAAPPQTTASMRRNKATWHERSPARQAPQQRIFVFMAGGMTYGELRAGYDVSQALNKEVVLCADTVLSPGAWLGQLARLRAPREALRLDADEPEPTMPAHLLEPDAPPPTTLARPPPAKKLTRQDTAPAPPPPGHFDVDKKRSKMSTFGKKLF
ncbi:Sec1-like protein, partial [Dipodascopsis tothii]|uniref:Sec1-like protein n=1 Tax=Dipodascopsis tothii TaxID=44089 RepID=UPI0034CDF7CF